MARSNYAWITGIANLLYLGALACLSARAQGAGTPADTLTSEHFTEDFEAFWAFVDETYAYFDAKATDWAHVRDLYRPRAEAAVTRRDLLGVLEGALAELYDPHAHVGANTASSPRLVPSGADLRAGWEGGRAVVTAVRSGSEAERVGVRVGTEVTAIEGLPVREAVRGWLPVSLRYPDPAVLDWALVAALAGRAGGTVTVETAGGQAYTFTPGAVDRPPVPLSYRRLEGGVGYVRLHNALGDLETVAAFDSALTALQGARALVLDLRDTLSGGNTTVARGIMGRLVGEEGPYQRHELVREERETGVKRVWVEHVSPRGAFPFRGPVVVLVGRWTGSMGEGLAIGLDGLGRATVVGSPMAGLLGALYETRLPHTGLVVRVPAERLYHVDGTPREAFVPPVLVEEREPGRDAGLEAALLLLSRPPDEPR